MDAATRSGLYRWRREWLLAVTLLLFFAGWPTAATANNVLPPPPVHWQGLAETELEMGKLKGAFGELAGLKLALLKGQLRLSLQQLRLNGMQPSQALHAVRLHCRELAERKGGLHCPSVNLSAENANTGRIRFSGSLSWHPNGHLDLSGRLRLAKVPGSLTVDAKLTDRIKLKLVGKQLRLAKLAAVLQTLQLMPAASSGYSITKGRAAFTLSASVPLAGDKRRGTANWQAKLDELAFANADSTIASDAFGMRTEGKLSWSGAGRTHFDFKATLVKGYAGIDPVFIDFTEAPLIVEANGVLSERGVNIKRWVLGQSRWLAAWGSVHYRWQEGLQQAYLRLTRAKLSKIFPLYAQPLLLSTPLSEAEMAGQLDGELHWNSERLESASLQLKGVSIDDPGGRFSVAEVHGSVHMDSNAEPRPSTLEWQLANAFRIPIGAAKLRFLLQPEQVRLLEQATIPLLDGALTIQEGAFYWGDQAGLTKSTADGKTTSAKLTAELVAELKPISWKSLTEALGWPEFGGTLGGQLPKLRYEDGLWQVDGALRAQLFDGELAVHNLQLESLLGALPIARADIQLEGMDLQKVTQAFDFGEITGRLNASIASLVLAGWQPVAFNAQLHSVGGGTLSQRALDTISDIGGSGGAAGRLFLGLFKNFPYKRIQWRCKLARNVCTTGGDKRTGGNGYYLIEGRSLPRVDVIGYATQVNWPTLLGQIQEGIARGVGQ